MTGDLATPMQMLARRCAACGLKLADAVALFEALYIADALAQAKGNVTRAGQIAGIGRVAIARRRRRTGLAE